MRIVVAAFVAFTLFRTWRLVESAQRERRDLRVKGMLYGEAVYHLAVVAVLLIVLASGYAR